MMAVPTIPPTNEMIDDLCTRVARGVALLDASEPGWRDRISPAELTMIDCARCVIGQVFNTAEGTNEDADLNYLKVVLRLGVRTGNGVDCDNHDTAYGFSLPDFWDEDWGWEALRQVWLAAIKGEELDREALLGNGEW